MPRVVVTEAAAAGLERCRRFLAEKDRLAAVKAGQIIRNRFLQLESEPESGRSLEEHPGLRELIISFGNTGYVALYRYDKGTDSVVVLAFRHQKEAGYS